MLDFDPNAAQMLKKSFVLSGHATSVALERAFWDVLERLAASKNLRLSALVIAIDETYPGQPLARKLRLAALHHQLS
jgi:predicted DNA-binding ribbon-helix-helix protein